MPRSRKPEFIDEIDPLDLMKFAEGFLDFFPALRSFASSNSGQTSLPASAGDLTTLDQLPWAEMLAYRAEIPRLTGRGAKPDE
ncbi:MULTISPECIES: hypothetical protein [unclassified Brucella]|uniref:hypothetical protein n=1 Tax=unclassified Brucella TaxID=2632610 RepID=UPI0012AE1010|nr:MULTISPECIES: hypothetical protein [unclassified Brucella]MRN44709.1 hypothetical protein [Brucella sp. 09RB8913]MRN59911.1 hypothetical protein [Brucella sp. 09RB8918]